MKIKTDIRSGYPGGSYTQSCEEIEFDHSNNYLKAYCQSKNGAWDWSGIYVPDDYDDIVNCDGNLGLNSC